MRGSVRNVEKCWKRCGKGRCGGKCEECGKVLEEVWKGEMWVEV